MVEYLTQAVVLGSRPQKENDRTVDLFTKEFGRLEAKVIGGRKILSKLSPHLDLFNLVTVRLVEKNQITLTDVLTDVRFEKERQKGDFYPDFLKMLALLRALAPKAVPDPHLWHYLVSSLRSADGSARELLKVLGYDPAHAVCDICQKTPITFFRASDQSFFCRACGSKAGPDELIYI